MLSLERQKGEEFAGSLIKAAGRLISEGGTIRQFWGILQLRIIGKFVC